MSWSSSTDRMPWITSAKIMRARRVVQRASSISAGRLE